MVLSLLVVAAASVSWPGVNGLSNGLAVTPPMGWVRTS